jgi:hypothetical protein
MIYNHSYLIFNKKNTMKHICCVVVVMFLAVVFEVKSDVSSHCLIPHIKKYVVEGSPFTLPCDFSVLGDELKDREADFNLWYFRSNSGDTSDTLSGISNLKPEIAAMYFVNETLPNQYDLHCKNATTKINGRFVCTVSGRHFNIFVVDYCVKVIPKLHYSSLF